MAGQLNWPRGKTLGGSSSINGPALCQGTAQDYERWRQMGNIGWGWDDLLPVVQAQRILGGGVPMNSGATAGELSVSRSRQSWRLSMHGSRPPRAAGFPFNPDHNGASQEGVGYIS
jgi:choline dehydrogenase